MASKPKDYYAYKDTKTLEWINKAVVIWGDRYDYSVSIYTGANKKIEATCSRHGLITLNTSEHIRKTRKARGCAECAYDDSLLTTENFKERSIVLHNNKYGYELITTATVRAKEQVEIICPAHGKFTQRVDAHLNGHSCIKCNATGYSKSDFKRLSERHNRDAYLYFIRCYDAVESFFKIGITTTDLAVRFNHLPYQYEILHLKKADAETVWDLEKDLHSYCKDNTYKPSIKFSGHTECFQSLDQQYIKNRIESYS